jgi:hypothetical protein
MANVSGTTKMPEPPDEPERILPALGPEVTTHQPTELEIQDSADVIEKPKKTAKKSEELFPVKLLKNYRPYDKDANGNDSEFVISEPNAETGKPWREPSAEDRMRLPAGITVKLPMEEAKRAIKLGIGERNDPLPGK